MVTFAPEGSDGWIGAKCPSGFDRDETGDRELAEGLRSGGGTTADAVVEEPTVSALIGEAGTEDFGFEGADGG